METQEARGAFDEFLWFLIIWANRPFWESGESNGLAPQKKVKHKFSLNIRGSLTLPHLVHRLE